MSNFYDLIKTSSNIIYEIYTGGAGQVLRGVTRGRFTDFTVDCPTDYPLRQGVAL